MKEYKVIHNERVQGDHYFWNKVFGPKSVFNIELVGPTLTLLHAGVRTNVATSEGGGGLIQPGPWKTPLAGDMNI